MPIVLPGPLAGLMREHLATRRGDATIGQPDVVPWLFPGGRLGHPLDVETISERLKAIGLHARADRAAALFTLAAELPAAILARTLGISIGTAVSWQKAASGDWMTYAAAISRRQPGSGSAGERCPARQLWHRGKYPLADAQLHADKAHLDADEASGPPLSGGPG